jgi:hypothetical protein
VLARASRLMQDPCFRWDSPGVVQRRADLAGAAQLELVSGGCATAPRVIVGASPGHAFGRFRYPTSPLPTSGPPPSSSGGSRWPTSSPTARWRWRALIRVTALSPRRAPAGSTPTRSPGCGIRLFSARCRAACRRGPARSRTASTRRSPCPVPRCGRSRTRSSKPTTRVAARPSHD